jgi:hypothetical protein
MSDSVTPNDKLSAIAGRWNTSGYVIGDPRLPVEGTDIYEVLAGGHFLVHHVDVTVGGRKVRAIEVIGEPDPDSDAYLARSFDNDGNFEVMKLRIDATGPFTSPAAATSPLPPNQGTSRRLESDPPSPSRRIAPR